MRPSWESRLEAARKARTDAAGESGPAASRDLPLPENVTWHRVSLVTPVLEGWKIVTGVLAFVTVQNLDDLVRAYRFISEHGFSLGGQIGYYLLGLVALIALWVVLGLLSWWRRAYAVDADGVYLRSGILSRKLRTARLPRIQSVDVVHPLLGRIFGLGQLTVEVAGGRNSRVVIGFLTTSELQTLRDRILDLAAGQIDLSGPAVEGGAVGAGAEGRDTGGIRDLASTAHPEGLTPEEATGSEAASAPAPRTSQLRASHFQEHPLYSVDSATLLGSLLRHPMTYTLLLAIVGTLVVGILIIVTDSMTGSEALTIISSYITMVIALATMVWNQFNSAWNFHAAATPSGIRMSYGLTAETSRTLPPGRVHGVGLTGPILWRRKDWWKVDVTVAGRDERPHDGQTREIGNLLLPVGSRDTALRALWLVVPDLGVPDPDTLLSQALTGRDDEGVGVDLDQGAAHGREGRDPPPGALGLEGQPRAHEPACEDRVGDVLDADDRPGQRGPDGQDHRRSSMSSARVSALGPTTTWTVPPRRTTPWAPAALRAASSTSEPSSSSQRRRVMQGSISTMWSNPPRASTMLCA